MTLDKLKKLLEDGAITKAEYDAMAEKLSGSTEDGSKSGELPENIQALIQSAVDRATNKLGNENKSLRQQLEAMRKEHLTADQTKALELEEQKRLLDERDKAIKEKELRLFTIQAIKDAGLDDGGDTSDLVSVLLGADEESITANARSFKALLDKSVESQVKQRFQQSGRDMKKGGSTDTEESDDGGQEDVAVRLAKATAANNKATQSIISQYTGGKTE